MRSSLSVSDERLVGAYLERYAEPLVRQFSYASFNAFQRVIVIPIFDEPETNLQQLLSFLEKTTQDQAVLMIWVWNVPEHARGTEPHLRTQANLEKSCVTLAAQRLGEFVPAAYLADYQSHQLLMLDFCTHQLIPTKQGVGLARKLGLDVALSLIHQQYHQADRWVDWLYSTDADVDLPANYAELPQKNNTVACVYSFKHHAEPGYEKAMQAYEFSLHYYVAGLRAAGSPYAFHTIGSLMVASSIAYAKVRGMPKRSGAEDFYLLNKLAKLGTVETLSSPTIEVAGRPSTRVPFGTGPAIEKITQLDNVHYHQLYHPHCFLVLADFLGGLEDLVSTVEQTNAPEPISLKRVLSKIMDLQIKQEVENCLHLLGWEKFVQHSQQLKTANAIRHAFHIWFDAFVTLRFIHELRDRIYPNVCLGEIKAYLSKANYQDFFRGSDFDYLAWFRKMGI